MRELAKHLVACKAYTVLAGRPLPVEELRQRVQADARARALEKVRSKIEGRPLWRARDLEGRWYCPYCARATGIVYPDAADARDPFVVDVFEHLEACEAYRRPGARIQEQRAVAAAVEAANVAIDRRRRIGRLLREVRLYGVRDPFDCWVCPHCQRAQKSIVLRGPGVTAKEVEQVTRHLFGDCPDYRDGAPPAIGLQALEELARPPSNPVASNRPAEPSATGAADATWRRLRQDLDAVKNQVVADKRRHATSLREARSKQRRLLPALPDLPGYEFARVYDPCDAVGGDFYHVFEAAPGLWGVAIGDIAGHGIEAALLMGLAKKLLEVHGRGVTSPAQTLCMANRDIYSDLDERTFVTVFYGLLDVAERRFRFARAGHDPLLLWQADSSPRLQVIDSRGMALGVDEGPLFEQTIEELEVSLAPGDLLLQVTDGVTETPDAQGHQFGAERLHAVVEEHGQHEVEHVLWKIEKALEAFRGGAPRADDVTMVGFKVLQ